MHPCMLLLKSSVQEFPLFFFFFFLRKLNPVFLFHVSDFIITSLFPGSDFSDYYLILSKIKMRKKKKQQKIHWVK